MTIYDIKDNFPEVFVIIEDGEEKYLAIKLNASLKDLFKAYSDLVQQIDNEIILYLENLIKNKIETLEKGE